MQTFINDERMYQAGLLRIGIKMRKESMKDLEQLIGDTCDKLRLEPEGFTKYVHRHMHTLIKTVATKSKS